MEGQENQPPAGFCWPTKARIQCHACGRLMEYDAAAQFVQCFGCASMNAVFANHLVGVKTLIMLCPVCQTTNLAHYGMPYVRCGICGTISDVSHAYCAELEAFGPEPGKFQLEEGRLIQEDAEELRVFEEELSVVKAEASE